MILKRNSWSEIFKVKVAQRKRKHACFILICFFFFNNYRIINFKNDIWNIYAITNRTEIIKTNS